MAVLLGEYEATLDSKGRFLLPAGFKKQLSAEDADRFVINRGFENCLSLYPLSSWTPLAEKINALNDFDPKVREFKRYFLNGATFVEPDSAGRLLLPPALREYASLQKDLVMTSLGNKMEIWDSNKYKQFFDSFSPEAFNDLASIVMGGS
ncbi:MAG TPA: division/cell wall cluster transcriptional repressor MraZ [Niabella sp.]|jgi:MraZ protein|nr:division/cell wall cluster transcriptional repressor MraZ [Chitinophagaceae bacterium]HRO84816.1 division/cell wall cluster transcriptional repressor MraZ [Niabella sp.]